jgi:hypothetical protein
VPPLRSQARAVGNQRRGALPALVSLAALPSLVEWSEPTLQLSHVLFLASQRWEVSKTKFFGVFPRSPKIQLTVAGEERFVTMTCKKCKRKVRGRPSPTGICPNCRWTTKQKK